MNRINEFYYKLYKCDKHDYAYVVYFDKSDNKIEFELALTDCYELCDIDNNIEYTDYTNEENINGLVRWLKENCDNEEKGKGYEKDYIIYHFIEENMVVKVTLLSKIV